MKFVDLNTGSVYNGDLPYIHWFDDKQSTNLVYIKKLCVVDTQKKLNIKLDSNIFKLIDVSRLDTLQTINISWCFIDCFRCVNYGCRCVFTKTFHC